MDLPLKVSECSIAMVEELLGALNDWRGTQDIIRLTVKALAEVVKTQGNGISHINRQIAVLPDIQMFKEFQTRIENQLKCTQAEGMEQLLQEKVSRKEMTSALSGKCNLEQMKDKLDLEEFYSECRLNNSKIEKLQSEFSRKLLELSMDKELQRLDLEIKGKATWKDVQSSLENKIDKGDLAISLEKKISKKDVEDLLNTKVGIAELSTLTAKMESKLEKIFFDSQFSLLEGKMNKTNEKIEKLTNRYQEDALLEMQTKVNDIQRTLKTEIDSLRKSVAGVSSKKVDIVELEGIHEALKNKADINDTVDMYEKFNKELKQLAMAFKKEMKHGSKRSHDTSGDFTERINEEVSKIKTQLIMVLEDRKKDTIEHSQFLKTMSTQIKRETQDEINKLLNQFEEFKEYVSANLVRKQEFSTIRQDLKLLAEQKLSKDEFNVFSTGSFQDLSKAVKNLKKELKENLIKVNARFENMPPASKEKTSYADMIINKAEKSEIESLSSTLQSLLSDFSSIKSELKSNGSYFTTQLSDIQGIIENLHKEIKQKANTKEFLAFVENKADIEDTNKALIEIHKELDNKIDTGYYNRHMSDMEQSLSSLWTPNSLGRWSWKSGELRHGNLVPWESQTCNTLPEVFMWEKDKTSIVVMTSAIYYINLAIFSKKKLRIQVLVNGESSLDTGNKSNISASKIFGEFVTLPARARVSVMFLGDPAHGLLEFIKFT